MSDDNSERIAEGLARYEAAKAASAALKERLDRIKTLQRSVEDMQSRFELRDANDQDVYELRLVPARLEREMTANVEPLSVLNAFSELMQAWHSALAVAAVRYGADLGKLQSERALGESTEWKQLSTAAGLARRN